MRSVARINRLKLEDYPIQISCKTIYRAIYAGMFDTPEQKRSQGNRGAIRRLRHRGKLRRPKGYVSNRGKIPISHEHKERPIEANERSRCGDWEIDTIVGFNRKSGLLTLVDRKSRFLICRKLTRLERRHWTWNSTSHRLNTLSEEDLQAVVNQLNQRPRKCLGYRTPWEVYFSDMLHFT